MSPVMRRGHELRSTVGRRRRSQWLVLAVQAVNLCTFGAIAFREQGGPFAWVAVALLAAVALGTFVVLAPRMELRAIRHDVSRPPLGLASRRRIARIGMLVGSAVGLVALAVAVLLDSWLIGVAVALPILLFSGLFAFFVAVGGRGASGR